jgi:cytochrome c oxidase subunit IV
MSNLSYEDSKKRVIYGLYLLGIITLIEVGISLFGKGHIVPGVHKYSAVLYICGLLIAAFSLYKAYFIVYEFMHMKYEVKSLAMTVLLPTVLLVWAVIAFFQEGSSWKARRDRIKEKNAEKPAASSSKLESSLLKKDTYILDKF